MRPAGSFSVLTLVVLILAVAGWPARLQAQPAAASTPELHWYKGSTHVHSIWSDADGAPEYVAWTYRNLGYNFIYLTDHNILLEGDRWFPCTPSTRLTPQRLQLLADLFGPDWNTTYWNQYNYELLVKLKTLREVQDQLQIPGQFLIMPGEEITSGRVPTVHINALNPGHLILPSNELTTATYIADVLHSVDLESSRTQRRVLATLNHPNYISGVIKTQDLLPNPDLMLFELYNGHPLMRTWADAVNADPAVSGLWDDVLTYRRLTGTPTPLYCIASDDCHNYFDTGPHYSNAGRGWIMVQAPELTPDAIADAIAAGRFYSTTGVLLDSVTSTQRTMRVSIQAEEGVVYTTHFIGTRLAPGYQMGSLPASVDVQGETIETGEILAETTANPAVYRFRGDELYVQARVVSSRPKANATSPGALENAWTQPVYPAPQLAGATAADPRAWRQYH